MSTTTAPAVRCEDCHAPIPAAVNAAIDRLYCGGGLSDLVTHLSALVTNPLPGASDEDILRQALTNWLGFEPTALVQAVRHVDLEEATNGD